MAAAGRPAPEGLTDDPAALAGAAREHLREKFLRAKVAVSGANFAVAETGTLVVVESEGNGRMCLTLPEVLVSVVGIEKVLPTWESLDPMLRLLPRSSTGERMNPYTSTWTGVTPGDGPQEVHVVLLDNGRTNALADQVGRQALRCIRCSACLNVCPVYERTGGHAYGSVYPGPIGAILNPLLKGTGVDEQTDSLPYASTLCGACFEVCPVRIDIPEVLVHLRSKVVDSHRALAQARGARDARRVVHLLRRAPARSRREALRARRAGARPGGAYDAPRRPARGRPDPRAGRRLDRRPRPARPAAGVLPRLVAAYVGRPGRCRRWGRVMSAREEILARVRAALSDVDPQQETDLPPAPRRASPPDDVVGLFAERVADYRAVVERCSAADLEARVRAALPPGGRVVVPPGLGIEIPDAVVDDGLSAAELDGFAAVVTAARLGIAETGTIVLDHQPDQGRRALSLVPDHHVCVVRADQVVPDVPDAVALLDASRPLTWISGPSATSDIELDRVEGVHGPRFLHVIIVG